MDQWDPRVLTAARIQKCSFNTGAAFEGLFSKKKEVSNWKIEGETFLMIKGLLEMTGLIECLNYKQDYEMQKQH